MSNDLERYLVHKAAAKGEPIRATLELTPLCNMNCRMCYIKHSKEETEPEGGVKAGDYWIEKIPQMQEMGILFVTLIGGEPFLYPELQKVYEAFYHAGFYISLTTNATLLADGLPDWLIKNPPRYITVSLYGASDEVYQIVTGNPKGYTQTIYGIENLLRANIPVKLNYIVNSENKQDLEKIVFLKNRYKLPLLATSYCFPQIRRNCKVSYERFAPEECAAEELRIYQYDKPEHYPKRLQYLAQGQFSQNTMKHTNRISCHAGRSTFWISWKGDMIPCGMMNGIKISVDKGSLKEQWQKLKEQVAEVRTSQKCAECKKREVCSVCPAMMEAETGDISKCPEYVCRITEEMIRLSKMYILE